MTEDRDFVGAQAAIAQMVRASARFVGLEIDESHKDSAALHMAVLLQHAQRVLSFEAEFEDDGAGEFSA